MDLLRRFQEMMGESTKGRESRFEGRYIGNTLDVSVSDVSESMGERDYPPSRLAGAKKANIEFVSEIAGKNPGGNVAIVEFSVRANVVCSPTPAGEGKLYLVKSIHGLRTHSSTNTAAGLRAARKIITSCSGVNKPRVLLLTDGHANAGGSPVREASLMKENGIQLDIIGIGGTPGAVNERQLKKMASVVNDETRYWFIGSVPELIEKFKNLALREVV